MIRTGKPKWREILKRWADQWASATPDEVKEVGHVAVAGKGGLLKDSPQALLVQGM